MLVKSGALLLALASASLAAPVGDNDAASLAETPWDIIVVGAGPAGIIVANRMAQAGKRTLLLEEGGLSYAVTGGTDRPAWLSGTNLSRVDVPGLYSSIFSTQSSLLCNSQGTTWANAFGGCTIGGSSAINAGLFFQPPASDWDKNNPTGWKSSDLKTAIANLNSKQPSTNLTSADGKRYLDPIYQATKKWLSAIDYRELDINKHASTKTKVIGRPIYDYINVREFPEER